MQGTFRVILQVSLELALELVRSLGAERKRRSERPVVVKKPSVFDNLQRFCHGVLRCWALSTARTFKMVEAKKTGPQ